MKEQEKVELRAPKPGESIRIVGIEEICVPNGTYVTEGTILIHFGSDKATITLEAEKSGRVFYNPKIIEGAEISTESVVGYILVGDNEEVENNLSNQPDMHNPTHRPANRFIYEPRWWQTDSDIIRLAQPHYDTIVGKNPSEEARNAVIIGIFCYKEQDGNTRHNCDHFALLEELRRDPDLVVGLFSFCLPRDSADFAYAHMRSHTIEFFETYLQASPHLVDILEFPNVVPFSFLSTGDLQRNLAFKEKFFDYFDYKNGKLTKK